MDKFWQVVLLSLLCRRVLARRLGLTGDAVLRAVEMFQIQPRLDLLSELLMPAWPGATINCTRLSRPQGVHRLHYSMAPLHQEPNFPAHSRGDREQHALSRRVAGAMHVQESDSNILAAHLQLPT